MYVPPLESILRAIGMDRASFDTARSVKIPKELFTLLLQVAVASSDFNEAGYLRENPDIAAGMRTGSVDDARAHYIGYGFLEGRLGATPNVDERWYMQTYADVALAVKQGKVASAREHYNVMGAAEGRSPSPDHVAVAGQWKRALTKA